MHYHDKAFQGKYQLLDIFITYLYYMCRSIVGSIALFLQRTLLRIGLQKEVFIIFRQMAAHEYVHDFHMFSIART